MLDANRKSKRFKRGDTIIEVVFAIAVFAMVSVITLTMMNRGIATGTSALQSVLARQEMDAQAEAIRFIHDSFVAERNMPAANRRFTPLWNAIHSHIGTEIPPYISPALELGGASCATGPLPNEFVHRTSPNHGQQFVINTRLIDPGPPNNPAAQAAAAARTVIANDGAFRTTPTFPRLIFGLNTAVLPVEGGEHDTNEIPSTEATNVLRVEGIWVQGVRRAGSPVIDFHIRACWNSPGRNVISTLGTIVRVYDMEAGR